jgi:PAS domain S-box-containing protein
MDSQRMPAAKVPVGASPKLVPRIADERWAFQVRLGDALRGLATSDEVQDQACRILGQHLAANRVHVAEIDGNAFWVRARYVNGVGPLPDRGPVTMFGAQLLEAFRQGEPAVVEDVDRDARFTPAERARLHQVEIAAFAAVRLTKEGRWAGVLGAHSATPRAWTPADITTIVDVADRIWTFGERAKAEVALRESEARYAAIFENSPVGVALTRWSDRRTVKANPVLLRWLGFRAEDVLGKTTTELGISTAEGQAELEAMLESQGSVRDFECRRNASSGATLILSLNLDWIFVNGEKHVLTTIRDLTDLRGAEDAARALEQERIVELARAEALRHSESRYSGILQASADAIVSVDAQQRIRLFNRAAQQIFGYAPEEVIGAPVDILLPGDQVSRVISERTAQLHGRRKDGEEFPADATISKVVVDGETIVTAALRDITSKLRGEIEQRLLSELGKSLATRIDEDVALTTLTTLPVREFGDLSSLYTVGEDGSVQRRGIACRDPIAQPWIALMKTLPVDRRTLHPLWQLIDTKRPVLLQFERSAYESLALSGEHQQALERLKPRSTVGVPLLVGDRLLGCLFVSSCWPSRALDGRDVALLEEVARRTALSLDNARLYRSARRAIQARDAVLAIVAHDLRTPLGSILLNTALTGPPPGGPERRSRRATEAIERAVLQMGQLIDDLLDVALMESGHLELDWTTIVPADLLTEVVETYRPQALTQSITLGHEAGVDLPLARGDRHRVLQVMQNLIANAMRAAPLGIVTLAARHRGAEVLFSVSDNGTGIAPDDLPHVFDRFWQVQKTRRGGAGLGLSIVKSIVESHGGRTWIESALGVGTTVFFTLPAEPA